MPGKAKNKPVNLGSMLTVQDITAWYEDNPLNPTKAIESFPLVESDQKSWKTMSNNSLLQNEAADPISLNSKVPVAGRPGYKDIMGEMAPFGKAREMTADEIDKFESLKRKFEETENAADAQALIDYYGNDLKFVRTAMVSEMAYLCWSLLSSACSIGFVAANSPYMQGITAMDYAVEAWQKDAVATSWADPAALILDDIESALELGDDYGKSYVVITVNKKWFTYIRKNTQVQSFSATLVQSLTNTQAPPTEAQINEMFEAYFQVPVRLNVIDEKVTRADRNDDKTTSNPFADGVAVFSQTTVLGHFEWNAIPTVDSSRETFESFFLVGNYKEIDPSYSKIYAKGRGFPVIDTYADNFYLKIDAVAWP
jgi:hypothetical protein